MKQRSIALGVTAFAVVAILLSALAAACSESPTDKGIGDAGVGTVEDGEADVVNFPDQFGNVAMKCDGHGHRIYVMTAAVPPVVVNDEDCN